MTKNWRAFAHYILDTIEKIAQIQRRGNIMEDEILYDATLRNLQTLSEATQSLPDFYKEQYPSIPWREIRGFRNILVHNYLGDIDPFTVQNIIEQYLPELKACIESIIEKEKP